MGGAESRRVTVENEDTIGVVKISESLLHQQQDKHNPSSDEVKRLWQELLDHQTELDYQQEKIDDLIQDAFQQGRNMTTQNQNGSYVEEHLRKAIHDKEQEITEIRKKKQMMEEEQIKKSVELEKTTTKEFNNAIEYMQNRYSDRIGSPVCSSLRVEQCYKESKSLNCSQLVHSYVSCIEQARKLLNEKKASL